MLVIIIGFDTSELTISSGVEDDTLHPIELKAIILYLSVGLMYKTVSLVSKVLSLTTQYFCVRLLVEILIESPLVEQAGAFTIGTSGQSKLLLPVLL